MQQQNKASSSVMTSYVFLLNYKVIKGMKSITMKEGYFFKTRSRVPPPWPNPDNVTSLSIRFKNKLVE